jgi:hypothetical protein
MLVKSLILLLGWEAAAAVVVPGKSCAATPICGTHGYDQGTQAYVYITGSQLATQAACGAKCAADSRCRSFAFGSGACLLYSVPVLV